MTTPHTSIVIRPCSGIDEYAACVQLQGEIWGYDKHDLIPTREFIVVQRIGGQVIGAFDASVSSSSEAGAASLIGFAMAMPGIRDGQSYLHSHMLAVKPEYRNAGIGRKLKLAQRKEALGRGIRRMEWTFDPLEIKNAYLNIQRLGAIVHSFTPNFYGVFSSRLQGGLPTDRLHAEWWMDSDRVRAAIDGRPVMLPGILETITVPGVVREWRSSSQDFARAESVQTEIRNRFQDAFARGLAVVGFMRNEQDTNEPNGVYQLSNWREP